jgi:hypothetical protein
MSATPRTDKVAAYSSNYFNALDLARTLERENAALRDALLKIAEVCNGYDLEAGWACKHAREALQKAGGTNV